MRSQYPPMMLRLRAFRACERRIAPIAGVRGRIAPTDRVSRSRAP